jgi:hypothetical protein
LDIIEILEDDKDIQIVYDRKKYIQFDWAGDIEIVWTFIREYKYMKVVAKRWQGNKAMNLKKEGIFIHVPIKLRRMRELLIAEKQSR